MLLVRKEVKEILVFFSVTMQNKVKKFLGERKALQQQLQVKRKTMKLLKSELKSRTEYLGMSLVLDILCAISAASRRLVC